MEDAFSTASSSVRSSPSPEMVLQTVTPSVTSMDSLDDKQEDVKFEEKKPAKKRKSWGQELPTPKTNLPPRYA